MKIILINGAPRSGKDSAGRLMSEDLPGRWIVTKFATEVKERCHAAYGLADEDGPYVDNYFEHCKDEPRLTFMGLTPRQAYIHFSETYMKAVHGEEVFGKMLVRRLLHIRAQFIPEYRYRPGFIITDSGFAAETRPLVEEFGADAITLIRLHRPGYTFEGDSRSLIDIGVPTYDVNSPDGDLPGLLENIKKRVPFLWR